MIQSGLFITNTGKIFCAIFLLSILLAPGSTSEPQFDVQLRNLTIKLGSDASFTCIVKHLGEYRIAWIRSEDKAILALHNHMVTHNHRFSVSHNGHNTWTLHIKNVQRNDSGSYLCQINTDPQRSQLGTLDVVVPADIIDEETSNDIKVMEGHPANLSCKARGHPQPKVRWVRQDRQSLPLKKDLLNSPIDKVDSWEGEVLLTRQLYRSDNGPILCIANNSVPPVVSKRVMVYVEFKPLIKVANQNQLVAAPAGENITLECIVESVPRPVVSWFHKGQLILNQVDKYCQDTEAMKPPKKEYSIKMKLSISNLTREDFGDYNCTAGNSHGTDQAIIKLQQMRSIITTKAPTTYAPIDWRQSKHLKHNVTHIIRHVPDKMKNSQNKTHNRSYEGGEVILGEGLTTSSSLFSTNIGNNNNNGVNKRDQTPHKTPKQRLEPSEFPRGSSSSASSSISWSHWKGFLIYAQVILFHKHSLPLSLIPWLFCSNYLDYSTLMLLFDK